MIERRCRLCFALKSSQHLRVAGDFVGQEFERDEAVQLNVLGLVHYPHAAAAQLLDNAVVRDRLPKIFWPGRI